MSLTRVVSRILPVALLTLPPRSCSGSASDSPVLTVDMPLAGTGEPTTVAASRSQEGHSFSSAILERPYSRGLPLSPICDFARPTELPGPRPRTGGGR